MNFAQCWKFANQTNLTFWVGADTRWSRVHPMYLFCWWHWQHGPLEKGSSWPHKLMVVLSRRRVRRTHWLLRPGQQMGDAEAVPGTAGHFCSFLSVLSCSDTRSGIHARGAREQITFAVSSSRRDKTTVGRFACRLIPTSSAHPGLGHHPKLTNGTRWWHPRGGSRAAPRRFLSIFLHRRTSLIN